MTAPDRRSNISILIEKDHWNQRERAQTQAEMFKQWRPCNQGRIKLKKQNKQLIQAVMH